MMFFEMQDKSITTYGILWISLGNPYFTEVSIKSIIINGLRNFSKIAIIIPFECATYNYLAMGYDENKAISKARLAGNRIHNMINRILNEIQENNIEIINWKHNILNNSHFLEALHYMNELYHNNEDFRIEARNATKGVIENKGQGYELEKSIDIAVQYLLEELAFLISSPDVLNTKSITYLYHRAFPIYEKLITGGYDGLNYEKNKILIIK